MLGRLLLIGALLAGCGAEEAAPAPANPPGPATCPPLPELAPTFFRLLRTDQLDGVRSLLERRLTERQVTAVIEGLLRLLRQLDGDDLDALIALGDDPRLRRLLPLVSGVVGYLVGTPPAPESVRADLLGALLGVLDTCESDRLLGTLDALLQSPELPALLADLGAVIALEEVQNILGGDLEDTFRRGALTLLLCNITAAFIRPDFDVARDVAEPLAALNLDPLDHPAIARLLATLDRLLAGPGCPRQTSCAPETTLQTGLAEVVCCGLYRATRCTDLNDPLACRENPLVRGLVYDLLIGEVAPTEVLFGALADLAADPQIGAALAPLGAVLRALAGDDDLRDTLLGLVELLLEPEVAVEVLPEVALLLEGRGLDELLQLVGALFEGCGPEVAR